MASFNTEEPGVMWIDLNSAFATTEQQSRPSLRGKPVGVTNRISKECCVIAASYEAKRRGVKVGCRRSEAVAICPDLVMLETDPPKYHHVYEKLFAIMQDYTPKAKMKSIDEGVLDFHHLPEAGREAKLVQIGHEIKARVRAEIGDYMMINVGIGTNRFLAKMAASLHKPDGLDVLTHKNIHEIFATLELEDLTGIAQAFGRRLRSYGIQTPTDFLAAREDWLQKVVFRSICGSYWYQRLRGFEVDDYQTKLGMVGRQWVVKNPTHEENYLRSCLHYLTETVAIKLRHRGKEARGVCVWMRFCDDGAGFGGGWEQAGRGGYIRFRAKKMYKTACYTNDEIWRRVAELFDERPRRLRVRLMGVYLYQLEPSQRGQLKMFEDAVRADELTAAIDKVNDFYGTFTLHSADALTGKQNIKQKIPFGGTEYFKLLLKRG